MLGFLLPFRHRMGPLYPSLKGKKQIPSRLAGEGLVRI